MKYKDYYEILGINSNASHEEIKSAFRSLAFLFHPDKNFGDLHAEAKFKEIKEAYEILSNPVKRTNYHQKIFYPNFYTSHPNRKAVPRTAFNLLQELMQLNDIIGRMDPFRINQEQVTAEIKKFVSGERLEVLLRENDQLIREKIYDQILHAGRPLRYDYLQQLEPGMRNAAGNEQRIIQKVEDFLKQKKVEYLWNRLKIPFAILIAVLLCLLIYSIRQ